MIITLNGREGAGKSTVAKKIASELGYNFYYTGQIFRNLAKKRGLTVGEYSKLGETDTSVDREIDDYTVALSKAEDNFIIDSRMAWHFIPQSLKIYLSVDEKVGAERVFKHLHDENSRNEVAKLETVEDLLQKIQTRRKLDDGRYKTYYGVSIHDLSNYDLVVDTTNLNPDQVFEEVLGFIRSKINEKSS